jgi:hypothetical protein
MAHARAMTGFTLPLFDETPTRPSSLVEDPNFVFALEDLDRDAPAFGDMVEDVIERPLITQLVVPGRGRSPLPSSEPGPLPAAPEMDGSMTMWAACWIILLGMLAGASAAALMFRVQLTEIVLRFGGA